MTYCSVRKEAGHKMVWPGHDEDVYNGKWSFMQYLIKYNTQTQYNDILLSELGLTPKCLAFVWYYVHV